MAVKNVEIFGSKILKAQNQSVKKVSKRIKDILVDMYDTMSSKKGIGLAAPQIGINLRIIVIDLTGMKMPVVMTMINPVVKKKAGSVEMEEGCLSIPEVYIKVTRPERILVSYMDENWKPQLLEADDMLARVILHEIDHLNGILMVDKISDKNEKEKIVSKFVS